MAMTTMSSREFNQDTGRAKKAAYEGPVYITDRGRPSHVLVTVEEYRKITRTGKSLLETLAMVDGDDIEFDPPKLEGFSLRVPDFD